MLNRWPGKKNEVLSEGFLMTTWISTVLKAGVGCSVILD